MQGERVLLLTQSPVLRSGIQAIITGTLPIHRVFEAHNALEGLAVVSASDPTLIIIQDSLPGVTGFVAARMMREFEPDAKILILSDRLRHDDHVFARRLGADALVPASIDPPGFVETIRAVLKGENPQDDLLVNAPLDARLNDIERLSARELAVLDGLVRSVPPHEIATTLFVPEQTVKSTISSLTSKLGASDQTTAIVSAIRTGIVDLSGHLPAHEPVCEPANATAA